MTSPLKKTNWLAMAGIFTFIALNLQAQINEPDKSGYVPVKNTKIYYGTYGEGVTKARDLNLIASFLAEQNPNISLSCRWIFNL